MSIPEGRNFGPDDDLLVHQNPDGKVQFTTRGHDSEELPPEDVRKLITYLQELVGLSERLTAADLDAMPVGETVPDEDGDALVPELPETEAASRNGTVYAQDLGLDDIGERFKVRGYGPYQLMSVEHTGGLSELSTIRNPHPRVLNGDEDKFVVVTFSGVAPHIMKPGELLEVVERDPS